MKRQSRDKAANDLVRQLIEKGGSTLCKACSVPNWDIYHTPGNPCPKRQAQEHKAEK